MKRIKLFENFNTIDPIEVRDDIKTILYELEDNGYDVIFKAHVDNHFDVGGNWIGDNVNVDEIVSTSNVKFFIIRVRPDVDKDFPKISDIKKDLERFVFLLRDHLDYINPKNIRLENGGKWISIKI